MQLIIIIILFIKFFQELFNSTMITITTSIIIIVNAIILINTKITIITITIMNNNNA